MRGKRELTNGCRDTRRFSTSRSMPDSCYSKIGYSTSFSVAESKRTRQPRVSTTLRNATVAGLLQRLDLNSALSESFLARQFLHGISELIFRCIIYLCLVKVIDESRPMNIGVASYMKHPSCLAALLCVRKYQRRQTP